MGIPVLILGESGSGKSTSMRNLNPEKVGVYNVAGKPLPFRKMLKVVDNATYERIYEGLQKQKMKTYIIDDAQYLMAFEWLEKARELGYTKFTEIALNFSGLVRYVIKELPQDVIVYFLQHIEVTDHGKIKAKTIGKMIDSQITLEGLFSIVLLCEASESGYHFVTQSNGYTTAKSPMEMFPRVIDNDLAMVDSTIREYWNLGGTNE